MSIASESDATLRLKDGRLSIDIRVESPEASTVLVTTRNCEQVAGLTARQIRELIKHKILAGGRIPGSNTYAAKPADIQALSNIQASSPAPTTAEDILTNAGMKRSGRDLPGLANARRPASAAKKAASGV